jgi:glycosyltransferase involved in cell wall biosynthesis
MQEVVKRLSEGFLEAGHQVTVATSWHADRGALPVKVEGFHLAGNLVGGIVGTTEEINRYKDFVLEGDFDVVVVYAAQQWSCDLILPILPLVKAKKVFVPTGFSGLGHFDYDEYFKLMPQWLKAFDLNIFHSDVYRDHKFAKDHGVSGIVIPNGASEKEFSAINIEKSHVKLKLVHIGNHTGQKGHDELMEIYSRAKINLPSELIILGEHRLKSRCYLSCKIQAMLRNLLFNFTNRRKKVILKSGNRKTVLNELAKAYLFLFPSNIECSPIVLYEALASKTPFVASNVGNSVEIANWTKGGAIFPTEIKLGRSKIKINESTTLLETWCNNPDKRNELAKRGYDNWKENFTWEKIITTYLDSFEKLGEHG